MQLAPAAKKSVEKSSLKASIRPKANPWSASCPSRLVIEMLASKWVLLLVPLLRQGPKRNGDLIRGIPGVSQKMLTQTLRDLERSRLVTRRDFGEIPPRVEYALTPLGNSLAKAITTFDDWVIRHYYDMVETS
jgi:DNA-binding HxlR family transcriptional regulator